MKREKSQKEKTFLRETENGVKPHYFNPETPETAHKIRERRSASQVAEMRKETGTKPKPRPSARERAAAQVAQMRKAAGNFKAPAK